MKNFFRDLFRRYLRPGGASSEVTILHSEYRWRKLRNAYLKDDGRCNACSTDKKLEVHHVKPWHLFKELRYDRENLITLCRACHFRFGHGLNWKNWNPKIRGLCVALVPWLSDIRDRSEK